MTATLADEISSNNDDSNNNNKYSTKGCATRKQRTICATAKLNHNILFCVVHTLDHAPSIQLGDVSFNTREKTQNDYARRFYLVPAARILFHVIRYKLGRLNYVGCVERALFKQNAMPR